MNPTNQYTIVGLWNPGPEYAPSRHNAWRMVLDELAAFYGGQWQLDKKHHCQTCNIIIDWYKFLCVKTLDYYNLTGKTIQQLCSYYNIPYYQIIVIHDEIDLPEQQIKLKVGWWHGWNNGLKSMEQYCKTLEFGRVRIWVDRPMYGDVVDWVLGKRPATAKKYVFDHMDQVTQKIIQYCTNESKRLVK
jgi:PTH1 family peptidyl-tRNA hydrolase